MSAVNSVEDLVGEAINAVCFVIDYLELHFNGPVLRALDAAVMATPVGQWTFPQAGSREAMCELIGATVIDVAVDETRSIRLRLNRPMAVW